MTNALPAPSLTAVVVLLTLVVPAAGGDWPQWRGPSQDGTTRGGEVFTAPFDLRLVWSRPLGAGYSGISIADETAVTMFSDGVSDYVVALSARGGDELWRLTLGPTFRGRHGSEDGPSSTPAVANGRVFAVGPNGRLVALELATGKLLWQVDLVQRHQVLVPWYGFGTSPVPVGDLVYLSAYTRQGLAGLAFEAESGQVVWTVRGSWLAYQSTVEDRAGNGLLIADSVDLALVDPQTGSERFRASHAKDGDLTHPQLLPVGSDKVLLTYETHADLYRLETDSDSPLTRLWRSRELRDSYVPPVVHGQTLYGLSGLFLVAVDLATGERRWKSREPGARSLILVDDHLVLFASDGGIVVVEASAAGYSEAARVAAAKRGGYTPASFADGRILVRNTSVISCVEVVRGGRPGGSIASAETRPRSGAFSDFLERLAVASEPGLLLEEWWRQQESFPLVEDGSTVHFLYRGPARDVAVLGDMTADLHIPEAMQRVGETDLFYRSYDYERRGRWTYAFLVDLDTVTVDPRNPSSSAPYPEQNPTSLGYPSPSTLSVVEMPGWELPWFLDEAAVEGQIEIVEFKSESAYRQRDLKVYLPAGYRSTSAAYPVLYVLGSEPWLEHARLQSALDNLMGATVEAAIVVLVPYHKGSLDRLGIDDYAELLRDEIVPWIERRYRTRAPAVLLAAADDAAAAVTAAVRASGEFVRVAVHSPRIKADELAKLDAAGGGPAAAYVEWSRYEPVIRDENLDYRQLARRLVETLEDAGIEVVGSEVVPGPGWLSWSARLDRSLELLLPMPTDRSDR